MATNAVADHLTCRVVELQQATHDIRILHLEPPAEARFDFRAGQYARLGFSDLPARDYSMANRPDELQLEFHIRDVGDGTSRYAVRRLAPGETVAVTGPFGDAYLRADHAGPIIAIAGGSGLAPMKSIVETALHLDRARAIRLYFGVRSERDLYLVGHFERLAGAYTNLQFIAVVAEPSGPAHWRSGPVGDAILADVTDFAGWKAYLAGPPPMVEGTIAQLRARGLPAADIHADPFYSEAEKRRRRGEVSA